MMVVKVYMWPGGDSAKARLLGAATLALTGVSNTRSYDVRLLKDTSFAGPSTDEAIHAAACAGPVWRRGEVRGHRPGDRGIWDLLGAALHKVLGRRLQSYDGELTTPEVWRREELEALGHLVIEDDPVVARSLFEDLLVLADGAADRTLDEEPDEDDEPDECRECGGWDGHGFRFGHDPQCTAWSGPGGER